MDKSKKRPFLLLFFIALSFNTHAQVLDISNNKGIILPVVPNANNVVNPSEGQILYNQNSKSLNYNNGSNWQNLLSANLPTNSDSITYSIVGGSFQAGPFQVINLVHNAYNNIIIGGGGSGTASVGDLSFTKLFDPNSWMFKRNVYSGIFTQIIEFKFFKPNTAVPYYSIRLNDWIVSQYSFNIGSTGVVEQISLKFTKIAFKDWASNNGFAYNVSTKVITNGPY
ncbi:MAG: type VI secretion system tube protein Hcp [Bacteroidota bacterium]